MIGKKPTTDAERNEDARAKWLSPSTQVSDRFSDRFASSSTITTTSSLLSEPSKKESITSSSITSSGTLPLPRTLSASTHDVGSTPWLKLQTQVYLDKYGQDRKWDRVVRTTKTDSSADAVAIMATVRSHGDERILAVKQFRPPINAFTIELPAGLIDEGETAGQVRS
jgi:hypothetical protein